jgi:CoA transferase family III
MYTLVDIPGLVQPPAAVSANQHARVVPGRSGADVIIENFRPGALAAFGLDYETISVANPGPAGTGRIEVLTGAGAIGMTPSCPS